MSAYSSLNQGHRHPRIVRALVEQAGRLTLTSRAVHNDRMGPFLAKLCKLANLDMALPMNTGAEAVETAIKLARKWGYRVKRVPQDRAEIVVCRDNFHGRTTTIVGFSSEAQYREDFGPYSAGFKLIDFGDAEQLRAAIGPNTVAFLVEPIQAEAGIIVPPDGYLAAAREICRDANVLFVLDEIQTGLARTGKMFAYQHERERRARPARARQGARRRRLSGVGRAREPRDHDAAQARRPRQHVRRQSARGGRRRRRARRARGRATSPSARPSSARYLRAALAKLRSEKIADIRGRGLLIGIEIAAAAGTARKYCEALLERGVLAKDTHAQVIRLAPPLVVERAELDWLVEQLRAVLE